MEKFKLIKILFIFFLYKKNHLGTILPLLIGLVFITTALWSQHIQQYLAQHLKLKKPIKLTDQSVNRTHPKRQIFFNFKCWAKYC
jgi:hypothetical protein